jgi:hypothetical protein
MSGRDWRDMTPDDFDTDPVMVQGALFPAPDPCGTELLPEE